MPYRAALLLPAMAGMLAAQTGQRPIPPTTTQTPLPSAQAYLSRTGTTPKPSAQEYPARAKIEKLSIGAEYLVREVAGACSPGERDVEVAFLQPHVHEVEGAARPLAESAETATACSELKAHGGEAVAKFFASPQKTR